MNYSPVIYQLIPICFLNAINHITPDCLVDEGHNKQLFEREDVCSPLIPLLPTSQCEAISTHENVYAKRGKKVNKNH